MEISKKPLSAVVDQATIRLPAEGCDAVVSFGLVRRRLKSAERSAVRTSLYTFHDPFYFVLWSHLDRWAGTLDKEDLGPVLDRVETLRTLRNCACLDADVGNKYTRNDDSEASVVVQYKLRREVHGIDSIWCRLLRRLRDEIDKEVRHRVGRLSAQQTCTTKSFLQCSTLVGPQSGAVI
jgi:hypothetical protein